LNPKPMAIRLRQTRSFEPATIQESVLDSSERNTTNLPPRQQFERCTLTRKCEIKK
jgi:hypothetical protein